jgi:flavin-dependent dehydrogenase
MACALTAQREAARRGLRIDVLVFERKRLGIDHNQCAGVLSPPILTLLREELDITLPAELLRNEIHGYVLHGTRGSVTLRGDEQGGATYTVRRNEFDAYLAKCAAERGIRIVQSQVTDLEFRADGVFIFTWIGTFRADVVVGAFGTGRVMEDSFGHSTAYTPPPTLGTLVARYHPEGHARPIIPGLLDGHIHVFLPPLPRVEFGSLIPKGNHVTVIVAGRNLRTDDMRAFLALPQVRGVMEITPDEDQFYKGRFPVGLAGHYYGDRYVTAGDAAGLVRPFKGKGVTSAIITGGHAAMTLFEDGISARAFDAFARRCAEITGDLWYGRMMRRLAWTTGHRFSFDPVIRQAEENPALRALLFDCVSGGDTYRNIVRRPGNVRLAVKLGLALLPEALRKK